MIKRLQKEKKHTIEKIQVRGESFGADMLTQKSPLRGKPVGQHSIFTRRHQQNAR